MGVPIRRAGRAERDAVIRVLDAGFFHDPVSSWVIPSEERRRRTHKVLMGAFLDMALSEGYVDMTDDGSAVALWLPMEVEPAGQAEHGGGEGDHGDDAVAFREAVDPDNERIEQIARLTAAVHPTHASHDYLMLIAVAPDLTGRGLGTALLGHALDRLDREARPAYLEASSERSRVLYERLGFRPHGAPLRLPDGPPMHPLWRAPRPPATEG